MRLDACASFVSAIALVLSANAQTFDENVDALAERLAAKNPAYQEEGFIILSESTKGFVQSIDKTMVGIQLYKTAIDTMKHEPSLTHEQLRWLVEIEDLFMDAERAYSAARLSFIMADKSFFVGENERTKAFQSTARSLALGRLSDANRKWGKARRDLATLRARVEIQKGQR